MLATNRIRSDVQECDCTHMAKPVTIRSEVVYPAGILRGTLPRIISRKCDHFADCRLSDKSACPMGVGRIG